MQAGLLQVGPQLIDLFPKVKNGVLVYFLFNPEWANKYLCSFSARSFSCCSNSYFSPS
jgi:hypothetical protein